ncbi:MAG: orotate phosphoribosyltransferase [Omnitrophica bacterium RIFCSPHIGHO2_02_FULL_46_11]|nr:MAG: orotate phosphoribosyltransferase [Omnitrophica bacterium RIFCSPHIGHO2_02_FULL_46_11]OGW86410.1 MAG: orotate phosphoribosyltransferase [Omnitrophica bacterium RIFCSPLOWO2_01_FULL_45_10b]
MAKLEELKAKLLPIVKKQARIKLPEPIKLSSGKMSDVYFDGRKVTLHPEGITLFARAILELVPFDSIDAVGGPSLGADPIATAVSIFALLDKKKEIPAFLIRKEPKQYGLQKQVEGADLKPGMRVLIVEDVVTTGKSVSNAILTVEALGAKVTHVVCLVDRNEGARETLDSHPLISVFTRREVES